MLAASLLYDVYEIRNDSPFRSFALLTDVDPGFRSEGLLSMRVDLSNQRYRQLEARIGFYDEVLERVSGLPGIDSAGMITFLPMRFGGGSTGVTAEEGASSEDGEPVYPVFRIVSPGYLETMGIPVRGRAFDNHDRMGALPVAVVNEAFARARTPSASESRTAAVIQGPHG